MFHILRAGEEHIPAIIEIWKEFMDFHRERDPFFSRREDGHANFEKFLDERMASPDSLVLVAIDDSEALRASSLEGRSHSGGKVVAYSIALVASYPPVFERRNYGHLSDIAVLKGYRRRGIGERMLAEIRKFFAERGITRIELRVASGNDIGVAFWRKMGFREFVQVMYMEI